MGKRRRDSDSDATLTTRRADCNTVYVDTSLDTGIAMLVFESDTVADFKKKVVAEHKLCYPETELHIRYLKVKHESRFYCLSDPMLVWSAFLGVERGWTLWVDASAIPSNQKSSGLELVVSTKTVDVRNVDDTCGDLSSDIDKMQAIPMPFPDGGAEKNDVLDMIPYVEFGNSLETESPAKKKRKTRHTEYERHDYCSKESDDLKHASSKDIACGISTVDAVTEGINAEVSDERKNDNLLVNTIIPDDLMASQKKCEPGPGIQADYSGASIKRKIKKAQETAVNIQDATEVGDTIKGKNIKPSPETHKSEEKEEEKVLIANSDHEDEMPSSYEAGSTQKKAAKTTIPSNKKKKKNKKIEKMSANTNLEKSDAEKIDYDISGVPSGSLSLSTPQIPVETGKKESTMDCQNPIGSDEKKNGTFSESTIIPENLMVSKEYEPDLDIQADSSGKRATHKETQNSPGDGHAAFPVVEKEHQIVTVIRVEKDTKNTVNTGKSVKKKRKRKTPSSSDVQEDIQLKFLNGSTLGVAHVGEEVPGADENEAEFVMSTQTKRILEDDASGKGENHKESSPGDGHSAFPVVEKENHIVKVLPVEKDTENVVHTGKSSKKKSKKKTLSTSGVQEDVQLKLLNSSTLDVVHVGGEVQGADGNEAEFVMSTQSKRTSEATDRKAQHSPRNGHVDIPVEEKENQIVDSLQVEKDTENIVNTNKSAKKKRKNKALAASDVHKDLPDKNQIVGIGSSTEENSIKVVNSEVDGIHVASSQVISRNSKENLEEKHEIAVYTDDLSKTTENESEGVNFKQYFVPDHSQDKFGSHGKAKKPNQSDKDKKTLKKLKKNGSSSVSISTEVQSSSMISADGERQNISLDRKDNGKGKGDPAQNSDWGEKIPNSSRRSSRPPENLVQDSITSETLGTLSKKPKEILAVSSLPKKKNDSLKKSSPERTEKFLEKKGNKMPHFGVNDTNRMGLKTPEKKSLLTKQGSLFDYNSGESSGDDNGTLHSSDSTQSPSDSSYTSDYSEGESELSLDSTKRGSSDAQVRSTGGKGTPKLDLSAMKDVPMMTILQSSNRYKKAKLRFSQNEAYQNDSQPIEFVPDSQPF